MSNPNNCETCKYSQLNANREKGHCYMFRDEPTDVCMAHTGRQTKNIFADLAAQQIPLGREFSEVLHKNLWDLYEG